MDSSARTIVQKAPEGFLGPELIVSIQKGGIDPDRRRLIRGAFSAALGAMAGSAMGATGNPSDGDAEILNLPPWSTLLGKPVVFKPYGDPSIYETSLARRQSPGLTSVAQASVSFAPLQGLFGIITPSGLHFERHHQGWVDVDPSRHRLMINGLVGRPRVYTMDDLMRLPSVSRIHFIECGANSAMEWANVAVPTVQYTHGMISCSEFTGVPLSVLLDDAKIDRSRAKFVLAEGADGSSMTRTIPMERALDDAFVAYGMNGEMLRPENGYPLRLVVPGVQGVSWVKWLRRIEVGDQPYGAKDEVAHYVDLMPDGRLRQYTSIQEAKSVITTPSGGQKLVGQGFCNVTGLAWSGRGTIKRVDVSFDGGRNWKAARLESPQLPKALTRFNCDWTWDGSPCLLQSRAMDDTGFVQPSYRMLREVRGTRSIYHNNAIQTWRVDRSGEVSNVQL
ncbi:sulfur dehydrogenase subunit SoxC [Panacagrimonas perspica]|uniref:Sulfur dehydrogenase subunit SoxC n=1 Tax=Panacagrimonas perspica TaxID=381431 RepID=A0A4S3K2A3_9GAMM|nr:sulfite dehydrogenase [Panacagrimonas perspica]TDU26516.1 sulfur dehydrogenase subunit SoxC [Panacagrimonas perspica]THD02125.1 sulfite dehydrogenase [Panacagrimonas perspica]